MGVAPERAGERERDPGVVHAAEERRDQEENGKSFLQETGGVLYSFITGDLDSYFLLCKCFTPPFSRLFTITNIICPLYFTPVSTVSHYTENSVTALGNTGLVVWLE